MLKRVQNYAQAKPLQTWLISAMFLLMFYLTLYHLPGTHNIGLLNFNVCLAIEPPTIGLLLRMSDEHRLKHPVPPEQEAWTGLLSVCAAVGSIAMLLIVLVGKRSGLSFAVGSYLLMLYGLLALLAVAFGYAARYTPLGRCGMKLAAGWIILIFVLGFAKLLILLR